MKLNKRSLFLSLAGIIASLVFTNVAEAKPTGAINSALSKGKAVLISDAIETMNTDMDVSEVIRLPGVYRPPITYWKNRFTGEMLIIGTHDASEGKGKGLTSRHFYYEVNPGIYDLVGYVYKTRFGDLQNLPVTNEPIKTNIGFVNYSGTQLPQLYTYDSWVPPSYSGSTFNGNTITEWYNPGYWEKRKAYTKTNAIFVDVRKLVGTSGNGDANIASFLAEPGKMLVVPDFALDFTTGSCNVPVKGQWLCPITSLTLSASAKPQLEVISEELQQSKYPKDFIEKVGYATLLPGKFFNTKKAVASENYVSEKYRTKYYQVRVTELTLPKTPAKSN